MLDVVKPVSIDLGKEFPDFAGLFLVKPFENMVEEVRIDTLTLQRLQRFDAVNPSHMPADTRLLNQIVATFEVLSAKKPAWFERIDDLPMTREAREALFALWNRYQEARAALGKKNPAAGSGAGGAGGGQPSDVVPPSVPPAA
ncbi:MAG: hypothetical protein HY816_19980 [Candidatus Wallbacteria bacterium]|nr:hypothetical protein [Candidatus Wallbacteria bacterium]